MYPAIAATSQPVGLGFSSSEIARTLLFLSPIVLTVQFVVYPKLSKRFSYPTLLRASSILFLIVYISFPFVVGLSSKSWLQWICLLVLLAIRITAVVIGYTSMAILVSFEHPRIESCPLLIVWFKLTLSAPHNQRGTTVSFAQAAISASRAVGPATAGALWSWGLSNGLKTPLNQNILVCLSLSQAFQTLIGL